MRDTVRVSLNASPFGDTVERDVPWREMLTLGDIVPDDWDSPSVWINRVQVDTDQWRDIIVPRFARVAVSRIPQGVGLSLAGKLALLGLASLARNSLFAPPAPPKERGDETSPTYSFSGISTSRIDGQPIQVAMGGTRAPGQLISEFVRATHVPPQTTLFVLLSYGHGPIKSIGGITTDTPVDEPLSGSDLPEGLKIEGNDAQVLEGVEAYVRMGTIGQDIIPWFDAVYREFIVSQDLLQVTTSSRDNSNLTIDSAGLVDLNKAASNAIFDTYGVTFDITTDQVDAFVVRVLFPGGLYSTNPNTGDIEDSSFAVGIRYRELNAGGVPVTAGGPHLDGWVRLTARPTLRVDERGDFRYDIEEDVYDPQNYQIPAPGLCLDMSGGGGATATKLAAYAYPNVGDQFGSFSVSAWVYLSSGELAPGTSASRIEVIGDYDTIAGHGWRLGFRRKDVQGFPFANWVWVPTFQWGAGAAAGGLKSVDGGAAEEVPEEQWIHLVGVFHSEHTAGFSRGRLYVNGELVAESQSLSTAQSPVESGLNVSVNAQGAAMLLDDVHIFDARLTNGDASAIYNSGRGVEGPYINDNENVGRYVWDQIIGAGGPANVAVNPWYSTMSVSGGATTGVTTGVVESQPFQIRKRMRVRVQVVRLNEDSESPFTSDESQWEAVVGIIRTEITHTGLALLGIKIPATEQINTTRPQAITCPIEGVSTPTMTTRPTSGQDLSPVYRYTANPAWLAWAQVSSKDWGLGGTYDVQDIARAGDLYDWAQRCDEIVYDGSPRAFAGISNVWNNITYDANATDPDTGEVRGSFTVIYNSGNRPTSNITPGRILRLYSVPTPTSGISFSTAISEQDVGSGYVIRQLHPSGTKTDIECWWDRKSEGDPLSPPNADLQSDLGIIDLAGARLTGGERRFEFNGVFDRAGNGWDALLAICRAGWAFPVRQGGRISFRYQRERDPVGMIGMGHLIPDTYSHTWVGEGENVVRVEYADRDSDYELTPDVVLHSSVLNASSALQKPTRPESLFGLVTRGQVRRHCLFFLNGREVRMAGGFEASKMAIPYEVGDVVYLSHEVARTRGSSGRLATLEVATNTITPDVDVEIETGKTYRAYVEFPDGLWESKPLDALGAGVIAAGTTLALAPGNVWNTEPPKRSPWMIVADEDALLIEIVSTRLTPDLRLRVEWREYRASDYQITIDALANSESAGGNQQLSALGPPTGPPGITPQAPRVSAIADAIVRTGPGAYERFLYVSWENDAHTVGELAGTAVLVDVGPGGNERELVQVSGSKSSARVLLPAGAESGTEVSISIRPVSRLGASPRPTRRRYRLAGLGPIPPAPTAVTARMAGDRALYGWTLPEGYEELQVEIRRGSSVLGPLVARSEPGSRVYAATRDWAGASVGGSNLYFRTRNPAGMLSEPVALVFEPDVNLDPEPYPGHYGDQAWEAFGAAGGWVPAAGVGYLTVGLAVVAGELTFGAAATQTTGTYVAADPEAQGLAPRRPRDVYVEAVLDVVQVHPDAFDANRAAVLAPGTTAATWEGPVQPVPGLQQCAVEIQWRTNPTGDTADWGGWQPFTPGRYLLVEAQWRLVITRPDASYNLLVRGFRTRMRVAPRSVAEETPVSQLLAREVF